MTANVGSDTSETHFNDMLLQSELYKKASFMSLYEADLCMWE